MNERIRKVRKCTKLSQTAFGEKIGVTIGVIKNLERGLTTLTSPLLELFCSTYNVNAHWLLTGEGEMFNLPISNDSLAALQKEFGLSEKAMCIVKNFVMLSSDSQEELYNTFCKLIENPDA